MIRVRLVPVEVHLCPNPGCGLKTSRHAYEGPRCPSCRPAVPPERVRAEIQERLVVMDERGAYTREARMKCAHTIEQDNGTPVRCDSLYAAKRCPLCGGVPARGQRPTLVWVRTYPGGYSDEDLDVDSLPGAVKDDGISAVQFSTPPGDSE